MGVMHPMKLGLGLALLLHVAAGLSHKAQAKLEAFRAQLEAKEAGAVAQDNPKGKGLIMPGKLPKAGAAAPGRRPHFDETGAVVQDNPKGPQVDIMPGKLPGAGAAAPGAAENLPTSTQDSIMSSTTDEESKPEPQVDIMPGKLPGAGLPTPGLPISDLTTSTQDSIMSSTTDDARRSSSTTTAYPMAVDPTVSSTTSAVITPEPKGPQTDSMLGQLVKAAFEKLRSGKGISMIVDVKNLEEFIQS